MTDKEFTTMRMVLAETISSLIREQGTLHDIFAESKMQGKIEVLRNIFTLIDQEQERQTTVPNETNFIEQQIASGRPDYRKP